MVTGICRLCDEEKELQESHILPAFIFRWLRKSSGNGHIRLAAEPNRRVQDGYKRYWLCLGCEGLLNKPETIFATKVFHPYTNDTGARIKYSRWMIQFCTSVSWRVLRFYLEEGHIDEWEAEVLAKVQAADEVWKHVLLGKLPNPARHEQHLLPVDRIEKTSRDLPSNINRYLMRAVDMDICRGSESIFTLTKFGRFVLIGFVHEPNPRQWQGTKVHAKEGWLEPRKYVLPSAFWDYLMEKAQRMGNALSMISDKQNAKIEEALRENVDQYASSDAFQAMSADVDMFGKGAFIRGSDETDTNDR